MAGEGFFKRWSRRKIDAREGQPLAPEPEAISAEPLTEPEPAPAPDLARTPTPADALAHADASARTDTPGPAPAPAPPTMADVALLTSDSDFSAFVRQGVDADVRRTALKKLFADPHFNTMDRLDVYIDDYTKPSPVSEAMLASLRHAKSVFQRLAGDEDEHEADEAPDPHAEQDPPLAAPASVQDAEPSIAAAATTDQQHPPETETR